ncbi:NAD(P)H-dependent flavin oxidoreductase [Actinokineospora iranica]|uniref:Propionate 3-nitronate monooxygenase n=1 Tax=Actinokineospora iranica TaxID=1271860 RepID=A0A1G6LK70_9PSEU|nr:nitronate monooxygenase [Actinokineospora iranica]SDC43135.1 nitronate monooxygenase [Actinokineospora iranica]
MRALFGIEHPIAQGPFGGGLSSVALAAAVSEAGGLGSFGAHLLGPERITALVADLRAATAKPFAVNLWVPHPGEDTVPDAAEFARHVDRVRPYLTEVGAPDPDGAGPFLPDFDAQLAALLAAAPPVISFVMGVPPEAAITEARDRGIVTVGTATTVDEAVALAAAGVHAVVASGSDAGGHRGAFLRPVGESLVGTFSLVPQVADAVPIPVIAAGGIADARGVAAALALGADGVQIGTGFLATKESGASAAHKAALHSAAARSTTLTRLFTGRHARTIVNRMTRELADQEDSVPGYPVQSTVMAPIRQAGEPGLMSLWAGQGAPLTRPRSAKDYVESLLAGL